MYTKPSRVFGFWILALSISAVSVGLQDYPTISYRDAADHIDEIVWVEGKILRTEKAREGTYLLFSANDKYVRLLVPAGDVSAFDGSLSHMYTGKQVKAIGKVTRYGDKLIVGINEPKRIREVEDPT